MQVILTYLYLFCKHLWMQRFRNTEFFHWHPLQRWLIDEWCDTKACGAGVCKEWKDCFPFSSWCNARLTIKHSQTDSFFHFTKVENQLSQRKWHSQWKWQRSVEGRKLNAFVQIYQRGSNTTRIYVAVSSL